jgi:hypothetical protein
MDKFQVLPSDNILKLRKLTEQICNIEPSEEEEDVIEKLKNVIQKTSDSILSSKTERTKLKYYEKMFSEIKTIIN